MQEQILTVPIALLLSLLAPLYGLVAGLYVLLFKHSTNSERHTCGFSQDSCDESKHQIRAYVKDVDIRAAKATDDLKIDMNRHFDRLFAKIEHLNIP